MEALNRMYEKRTFLAYVFTNLIIQLCITYYVMNRKTNPNIHIILLFIAQLTIVIILSSASLPEYAKLLWNEVGIQNWNIFIF